MAKIKADPAYVGADHSGPAYQRMEAARKGSVLLMHGQEALRGAGETYLPRWKGQTEAMSETTFQWERRRSIATLHNLYKRALLDYVHQVFSRRVSILPEGQTWVDAMGRNIDGEGTQHDDLLRDVARDSMASCISHVLVDAPPPTGAPNAQTAGPRLPFWRHFPACEVIDVEPIVVGGETRVGLVRRKYKRREPGVGFDRQPVDIIQVLERGDPGGTGDEVYASSVLLRMQKNSRGQDVGWIVEPGSERVFKPNVSASADIQAMFTEVPFVPFYTSRVGFFEGDLALDTLCDLQMAHWRKTNELDNAASIAGIGMKLFSGFTENQIKAIPWGPMTMIANSEVGAAVHDISFSTAPLQFMEDNLEKLERKMAIAAVEPSVSRSTGEEKSTIRLMDEAKRLTLIQAWALQWMAAASQCWVWSAAYQGIDARAIQVEIKEEVFEALGQSATFGDLITLWKAERPAKPLLSDRTFLQEAQRYGTLSDRVDLEEERKRIDEEVAARAAAAPPASLPLPPPPGPSPEKVPPDPEPVQ